MVTYACLLQTEMLTVKIAARFLYRKELQNMRFTLLTITKTLLVLITIVSGMLMLTVSTKSSSANAAINPPIPPPPGDGASVYAMSCARCHGADGRAQTAKGKQTGAVDLTSDEWEPDDVRDTRIVSKGKGKMPAFKPTLKPDEINSVVAYIRRFKG